MKPQLAICLALLAIHGAHAEAPDWKQATGPLKTRWAKAVTPDNALPEYPRMQMVRKADEYTTDYEEMEFIPASLATLKPGKNIMAVHCRQTGGGQCIDVGISSVIEQPLPK